MGFLETMESAYRQLGDSEVATCWHASGMRLSFFEGPVVFARQARSTTGYWAEMPSASVGQTPSRKRGFASWAIPSFEFGKRRVCNVSRMLKGTRVFQVWSPGFSRPNVRFRQRLDNSQFAPPAMARRLMAELRTSPRKRRESDSSGVR